VTERREAVGPAAGDGHRPEVAVGAVVVDDDALLLVRRGRAPALGRWSVPGGRVEWGETVAHAVVREVLEETGVECVCGELLGWVERFGEDHHFVILDFLATPLSLGEPVPGDDASEARWVPLAEVELLDLVPGLAEFLAEHGIIELIA
jgi:ADP-ribose pyrophosphatase YjhB (NUDIX family)